MNYNVVIELRRNRVLAAWAGKTTGWLDTAMPEEMDSQERGVWLKDVFRRESIPDGKVLLVVPRREVVLLQLELGAPADASESDLHGVANMNLGAHSTMDPHACVLDVVPSADSLHAVCAAPSELVDRVREDLKNAGRTVAGVTTRSSGIATLADPTQTELFIGVGNREIEITVIHRGIPILSRYFNRNSDTDADITKIAAETHRALTSAKMVGGMDDLSAGHLYAELPVRSKLLEELERQISVRIKDYVPKDVRVPEELLPLMQLAAAGDSPVILLRKVRPPSGLQVPAVRIGVGLGVLAAIVLLGGAILLSHHRSGLRLELNSLRSELAQLQSKERNHLREEARLIHLQSLMQSGAVWSQHNASIIDILPESGVVLDRLSGSESHQVSFSAARTDQGRWYAGGNWQSNTEFTLDLNASVGTRTMVPRLRQMFIDDARFDVESKGPELPDRLSFRLSSNPASNNMASEILSND